jgi:hypothetical protein
VWGHRIFRWGPSPCIRMPELEEARCLARDAPAWTTKFMNKYTAFTLLVIDERLVGEADESTGGPLLELLEQP